jgi:small nuclear ribonucleoprotein (snRNP)-like protein
MSNINRKYKKESCRTLIGFLRCLVGQKIQIDIYGGIMIVGLLIDIDVNHNIQLSQVTMSRPIEKLISFHRLCIRYKNVRYIRIPDEINIVETIRQDLKQMNPKANEIVGGGQKKMYVKKGKEYERNLPPLRPENFYD